MILMEVETIISHPIEDVYTLTVDLERAPRWHQIFTNVTQLTVEPIRNGSRWGD